MAEPLLRVKDLVRRFGGVVATDVERKRATAMSGTLIRDFYEPLWSQGLALNNQGDIDTQAITGALSTGSGNFDEYRGNIVLASDSIITVGGAAGQLTLDGTIAGPGDPRRAALATSSF